MYVQILQLKLKLADQQRVNTQAATQQAAVIAAQQQAQQQAIVLAAQQQGVEQAQKARQNASLISLLSGKENHQQQQQQNISLLDMLNKNMGRGNSSYSPHSGLGSFTSSGLGANSNRQLSPSVSLTDLLANRYRGY